MKVDRLTPILNVSNLAQSSSGSQGIEITWLPTNMASGARAMHVRHPDGHVFGVSQGIEETA
jgi:hypothetical protein